MYHIIVKNKSSRQKQEKQGFEKRKGLKKEKKNKRRKKVGGICQTSVLVTHILSCVRTPYHAYHM